MGGSILKKAVLLSVSSDIGTALALHWLSLGWEIYGTYRTISSSVERLQQNPRAHLFSCDLLDPSSITKAGKEISEQVGLWDILVLGAGTLDPVGPFEETDFKAWEKGIQANFLKPLEFLHTLLPFRGSSPTVLFFAGGGTNNAVKNYSSYTLSKIALIKMVELLDAEMPDTRFVIVGPGFVKTKIHEQTLQAGEKAGDSLERLQQKMRDEQFIPMEKVVTCCHWLATTACRGVNGRNISVAFDPWESPELQEALQIDPDMYKLRRHKNSFL